MTLIYNPVILFICVQMMKGIIGHGECSSINEAIRPGEECLYIRSSTLYCGPSNGRFEYTTPPVVSSKCTKLGICDTVENYPTVLAQKLIQELKDIDALFLDDNVLDIIEDFGQPKTYEEDLNIEKNLFRPTISERFGSSSEDEESEENEGTQLCESTVHYHIPKIAENRNNTWRYILNDDRKPVQTFRTERCKSKRSVCSKEMNFMPNYGGVCVQRWTLKEMYYIDDYGKSATDYFKVPTCCSCRLFHKNK